MQCKEIKEKQIQKLQSDWHTQKIILNSCLFKHLGLILTPDCNEKRALGKRSKKMENAFKVC